MLLDIWLHTKSNLYQNIFLRLCPVNMDAYISMDINVNIMNIDKNWTVNKSTKGFVTIINILTQA